MTHNSIESDKSFSAMLFLLFSLYIVDGYPGVGQVFAYRDPIPPLHTNFMNIVTDQIDEFMHNIAIGYTGVVQSTTGEFSDDPDAFGENGHGTATITQFGRNSAWSFTGEYPAFNGIQIRETNYIYKITGIRKYAFARYQFSSIILPYFLEYIEPFAFYECHNLKSIQFRLPYLTELPEGAFYNCFSLTKVDVPGQLNKIGKNAFYQNRNLAMIRTCSIKHITCDPLISSFNSSRIPTFVVPEEYPDDILSDVVVPKIRFHKGFTWLEFDGVRYDILGNTLQIKISASDVKIKESEVFEVRDLNTLCYDMIEVTSIRIISSGNRYSIGEGSFRDIENLTSVELSEGIVSIETNAFKSFKLSRIEIPSSIELIQTGAFTDCTQLQSIKINGSPSIETNAFTNCNNLKNITFCGSNQVSSNVFWDMSVPRTIYVSRTYPYATLGGYSVSKKGDIINIGSLIFDFKGLNLYVRGSGCIEAPNVQEAISLMDWCQTSKLSRVFSTLSIASGITLGVGSFKGIDKLIEVVLPSDLHEIPANAFQDCGIQKVSFPDSVTKIGTNSFSSCNLSTIRIPPNIVNISDFAFSSNILVKSIIYCGKIVPNVAKSAFENIHCDVLVISTYESNVFGDLPTRRVYSECGIPTESPSMSPVATQSPVPTESKTPSMTPTQSLVPTQSTTEIVNRNPNNAVANNNDKGSKSNKGAIIGGVVGGFLFLLLLILIVLYVIYKSSKHAIESDELDEDNINESFLSDSGSGYNEASLSEFSKKLEIDDRIAVQTIDPESLDGEIRNDDFGGKERQDINETGQIDEESPVVEPEHQESSNDSFIEEQPEEIIVLVSSTPNPIPAVQYPSPVDVVAPANVAIPEAGIIAAPIAALPVMKRRKKKNIIIYKETLNEPLNEQAEQFSSFNQEPEPEIPVTATEAAGVTEAKKKIRKKIKKRMEATKTIEEPPPIIEETIPVVPAASVASAAVLATLVKQPAFEEDHAIQAPKKRKKKVVRIRKQVANGEFYDDFPEPIKRRRGMSTVDPNGEVVINPGHENWTNEDDINENDSKLFGGDLVDDPLF